ncbi:MAG TPA: hypothetical protein IAB45_00910 [Candidatus Onthousia faecavium]|nr:hypothetical protein [Candidatus Onthousia faecavium]
MKKKYIIAAVLIVLVSVIALIGTTYAFLTMTIEGDKTITLRAGVFKVDFTEGDSINLNNAAPVSDSKGQSQTPYTFTITNEGNLTAYYHVLMEEDSANTLANSYLKMRITGSNGYDSGVVKVSSYGTGTFEIIGENELAVDGTVTYNLWMWLDENADNSAQGKNYKSKIVVESFDRSQMKTVADTLLTNGVGENGTINTTDSEQTFITGTDPNNYIWYSGKLWRAVSIDTSDNSVKLVTQWNISAIPYNEEDNTAFAGSYMEEWLNDTSVDGFLGNLRDYENFIKLDSVWNATLTTSTSKPAETTMVEAPVGLLNVYEYTMSYSGTTISNGYLNNGLSWWSVTPSTLSTVRYVDYRGSVFNESPSYVYGVRPSINLKSSVKIVEGDGTADNPYRLSGDNDTNLSGTMLNTRYSGEYVRFGSGENNLYRIVSHENGMGTKITSAEPLKNSGTFARITFDSNGNVNYSSDNTIGTFLNNDYLNTGNGYLTDEDIAMIEDATTWYLGTVGRGASYKLAKYTNTTDNVLTSSVTTARVGLLRLGELMAGQFERYAVKGGSYSTGLTTTYWTLTPYSLSYVWSVNSLCLAERRSPSYTDGVRPSINLKSNVQIVNGDGTLNSPFELQLVS